MPTGLMLNLDRLDLPWTEYIQGGNIFFSSIKCCAFVGGCQIVYCSCSSWWCFLFDCSKTGQKKLQHFNGAIRRLKKRCRYGERTEDEWIKETTLQIDIFHFLCLEGGPEDELIKEKNRAEMEGWKQIMEEL